MERKLTDFFPFHEESDTRGKLLYLCDQQSMSGQFTFHSLLQTHLKKKKGQRKKNVELDCDDEVHLLLCGKRRRHVEVLLKKSDSCLEMSRLEEEGRLIVHELQQRSEDQEHHWKYEEEAKDEMFVEVTVTKEASSPDRHTTSSPRLSSPKKQLQDAFQGILESCLEAENEENKSKKNVIVMIDDLIALEVLLKDHEEASSSSDTPRNFLYNLQTLLSLGKLHSLVLYAEDIPTFSHSFGSLATEPFVAYEDPSHMSSSLAEMYKYRADVTVTTAKLDSGYSADVHGQILIVHRGPTASSRGESGTKKLGFPHQQRLLFKASDVDVKCSLH